MPDFTDFLSPASSIVVDTAKSAIGNAFNSWSGDSSKNKQKKLMHYQDVLNQKSLTESPTSARLGYEAAGFSPALALGTSAPTVSAGSSQMGNFNTGEPFSDTLTKGQQRKLMEQQRKLVTVQQFTDFANAVGKVGEYLERAGFNVPEIIKRETAELGLTDVFLKDMPSQIRPAQEAKISKDIADTGLSVANTGLAEEKKKTEVTQQSLNEAKTATEGTVQNFNNQLAKTQETVRILNNSLANLHDEERKRIEKLLPLEYRKMWNEADNLRELFKQNVITTKQKKRLYESETRLSELENKFNMSLLKLRQRIIDDYGVDPEKYDYRYELFANDFSDNKSGIKKAAKSLGVADEALWDVTYQTYILRNDLKDAVRIAKELHDSRREDLKTGLEVVGKVIGK